MCVIAVSQKGINQPSVPELRSMWNHNPHGSGYMVSRNNKVEIHKGFMVWDDFIRSVKEEHFSKDDSVIYHFRIATQGGINPEMTHPFPLASDYSILSAFDVLCDIGIAHNGIIPLTSNVDSDYSDTAIFISQYMTKLIRSQKDFFDTDIHTIISELACSKLAMMNKYGDIITIGKFYNHNGILLSNENHLFPFTYPNVKNFNNSHSEGTESYVKGDYKKCIAY